MNLPTLLQPAIPTQPDGAPPGSGFDAAASIRLAARRPAPTATILLPTHRAGPERQQDPIRARNLIHDARRQLAGSAGDAHATAITAPLEALIADPAFWSHPSEGLALIANDHGCERFWLPRAVGELAVVGEHAHLKPLMPLLQDDGVFHVLEITQHGVHLHRGTRFSLVAIDLPGAPHRVDEALGATDPGHRAEVHTLHAAGHGSTRYFGSVGDERSKERIKHLFKRVDDALCGLLQDDHAPLVLAGVDYLLPLFAETSRHHRLVHGGLHGDPGLMTTRTLHDRAWELVAPLFAQPGREARARYAQLNGSGRATDDLATVLAALVQGRIETLLVATDSERWGTYDALAARLKEHIPRQPGDDDLLNTAVIHGLATHAQVHALPEADLGVRTGIAAVLRY
jgi:hypothetical protein